MGEKSGIDIKGQKTPLLCRIGLHKKQLSQKFLPSIHALIVEEYISVCSCARCGKVFWRKHLIWDGEEMVDTDG